MVYNNSQFEVIKQYVPNNPAFKVEEYYFFWQQATGLYFIGSQNTKLA